VYWRDYLDSHDVKSVIVSHGVYHWYAIILRLAIQRNIPCYQINATTLYYLSKEYFQPYAEFYDYPKEFRELTPEQQRRGLKAAKERLDRRKAGDVGVDMWYSSKSAFLRKGNKRILPESPRIKVLIPPHCFFDSPHPFGKNLFPDFYEWLTFLGDISEKTDYDWYIKTHPDFIPANNPIIEQFLSKYPKFTLIPPESSHLQLIDDGLDFVLTVYGTVGSEYASLGIPVINASTCNPHIAYNFNIHPKTIEEYEKILMDLHNQKLDIDINEVYEHYYMKNLNNTDNWLFINYETFLKESGGYRKQVGSVSYQKFIEEFSERRHKQILRVLDKFVESKEYRLRSKHLEPERNVCSCLV
jgi:hypothetical protein